MTVNGKIMTAAKPNIEELMPIESQLKKDSNSESKVLTKMMMKGDSSDLADVASSIILSYGDDAELVMTLMIEKP